MTELFKANGKIFADTDLTDALSPLGLSGKNVLLGSSILSLGRPANPSCAENLLKTFQQLLGNEGTLVVPAYSFSAYNNEVFDPLLSKSIVGIVGETARKMPGFHRTIHPIYSHALWGRNTEKLLKQDFTTCFGPNSFFDILFNLPDTYILVVGTSLSAMAFYHYYDQYFKAPGRFLKKFNAKVKLDGEIRNIEFDSYVKDYENFYVGNLMNCLGRFDAIATELGFLHHIRFAGNFIHAISEKDFRKLYKACLDTDQKYFLCSTKAEWEEYFPRNRFDLFHGKLDREKVSQVIEFLEK